MKKDLLNAWLKKNGCRGVVEDSLQRSREERKRDTHRACVEMITGRKVKDMEQVRKELDQGDWF